MPMKRILLALILLLGFPYVVASAAQVGVTLSPGDTLSVTCTNGALSGSIGATTANLACSAVATATSTPTPAATPSLTVPPTLTATATPTATTTVGGSGWHAPTTHEHGDAPPAWAEAFSVAQFGHGIIFGGTETSGPAENANKHNVFKGFLIPSAAGGEGYLRYHAGSNPLDRSARYHSFELYYRDTAGGVSFWEGWYDSGDPNSPLYRCVRSGPDCNVRPIVLVVDQTAWDTNIRQEQWYVRYPGGVDFTIGINATTTIYGGLGENANPGDMSTWTLTGDKGLVRTGEFFITGQFPVGSSCLTALGESGPCDASHPMRRVIAPTLANDYRNEFGVSRISGQVFSRSYPCAGCVVPN